MSPNVPERCFGVARYIDESREFIRNSTELDDWVIEQQTDTNGQTKIMWLGLPVRLNRSEVEMHYWEPQNVPHKHVPGMLVNLKRGDFT